MSRLQAMAGRLGRVFADPAKATVAAGWIGRIVAAVAQFGAIRILTQMLGVDGYGAYAVVTGLLAWFMLADLGLGSSLQNHISARRVAGEAVDDAIWSTSIFLTLTTVVLAGLLALASPWIGPFLLDKFPGVPVIDAQLAFFAFGLIISGTAAANIVLKIYFAHHRGYLSHAITVAAAVLGVIFLGVIEQVDVPHKLVWAVVGFYLPGWVFPAIAISRYLARSRGGMLSRRLVIDFAILREFWQSARWFVLFAALGALTLNLDYVILSRTVSADEIAVYSVFSKIYTLVIALFASVLSAYWPVSSELIRRQDFDALRRLVRRALAIGAGLSVCVSLGIMLFLPLIGRLLSPDVPLTLPIAFVPAFTLYCLVRIWSDTFSMVIVSAGRAWVQCLIVPIQAALSLGIGYWAALHYGAIGVVVGIVLSFLLTVVWALPLYVKLGVTGRSKGTLHG
jgi:O-antigen/teichoic acid export membrane protein